MLLGMSDCACRTEPEVFLGKSKRREAVDGISTEDDMSSRRLVSLLNASHEGRQPPGADALRRAPTQPPPAARVERGGKSDRHGHPWLERPGLEHDGCRPIPCRYLV